MGSIGILICTVLDTSVVDDVNEKDMIKNVYCLHVKTPLFLSDCDDS